MMLLTLAGCAGPQQPPAEPPHTAGALSPSLLSDTPSLKALQSAAARQTTAPDASSRTLSVPPGIDAPLVQPVPEGAGSPARLSLDEVLEQFAGPLPNSEPPAAAEPPSDESRRQALRLYSSARARLFRGDSGGAIVDLESATRLDPMAAAPWRELGEAQLQQGKRLPAVHSFQQAVQRGGREPRVLWLLGRESLRAGRFKQAVQYFSASRSQEEDADPALPNLVGVDLSEALASLGYLRASTQALTEGLALDDQAGSTRLRVELGELLRRRSDLWRDLGDNLCRLGDYPAALEAYSQAQQLPTFDPSSIVPRQIYALMKTGHPAEAALLLLSQIHESQGRADERVLALIPYVASSGSVAKDLGGAIGELAESFRQKGSPTVADRLVRAQAAAAPAPEARAILRRHVAATAPSASAAAALGQLLGTFDPQDAQGAVHELLALIELSPSHTLVCAGALLNSPVNLDRALAALPEPGGTDAQVLLRASLLSSIGFQSRAADQVTDRPWTPATAATGAFVETLLNSQIGRWDKASAAYERPALKGDSPTVARLRAQAAVSLQRPAEAMEALKPLIEKTGDDQRRVDDLVDAARLTLQAGDAPAAEALFNRAVAADPFDERSYDGLIRLYLPGSPLASTDKVTETVRALRESCPSSRALRFNAAEEMAQRQLDPQAEQMLLELADEDLSDVSVGSMLVGLWDRRAQSAKTPAAKDLEKPRFERAESWLHERLARRPEQPWIWAGLARVLAAQGRAEEAVTLLADRLVSRPFPALAQMRESIVRDSLNRAEEADRLALARLEPLPRSLEASIELADLYVRLKRTADAAKVLSQTIPTGVALTDAQTTRLVIVLLRVSQGDSASAASADADGAAALFDAVAGRTASLPPQLHETRLGILATRSTFDSEALARAVDQATRQHPALASAFYVRVAAALGQSSDRARQAAAIPYLRLAVQKSAAPGLPVMTELVRQTVLLGTADDVRLLVEQFDNPQRIAEVMRELLGPDLKLPSEPNRARAEFAYLLGNVLTSQERRGLAGDAYRLALGLDPGHAWSKNNLGYEIVESGGDLTEASRLLEEAYAALPEESSVIDSLAWLRYKQGVIADDVGPDGKPRLGAVTLLERAAATDKGIANATIHDHLGDALWVAGKREEAGKAWSQAALIAQTDLEKIRQTARGSKAAEEAAKALQAILRKQRSLADGHEPAVAPHAGNQ